MRNEITQEFVLSCRPDKYRAVKCADGIFRQAYQSKPQPLDLSGPRDLLDDLSTCDGEKLSQEYLTGTDAEGDGVT